MISFRTPPRLAFALAGLRLLYPATASRAALFHPETVTLSNGLQVIVVGQPGKGKPS